MLISAKEIYIDDCTLYKEEFNEYRKVNPIFVLDKNIGTNKLDLKSKLAISTYIR